MHLVCGEDGPEVLDKFSELDGAELEEVLLQSVEYEVNAGVELVEVATVAIRAQ